MRVSLFIAALATFLALAPPANGQFMTGAIGGSTMILKGDEIKTVGEILAEVGYRFELSPKHHGELVTLMGAQLTEAASGGMSYRHYIDINQSNNVMPGFSFGGFVIGSEDTSELSKPTIFLGGGLNLDICPNPTDDSGDHITAYAEFYDSVHGDDGVSIVRFGLRASMN